MTFLALKTNNKIYSGGLGLQVRNHLEDRRATDTGNGHGQGKQTLGAITSTLSEHQEIMTTHDEAAESIPSHHITD